MFKLLKSEKGEALTIFLIGLVFTMVVAAYATNDLRVELKECQTPHTVAINLD